MTINHNNAVLFIKAFNEAEKQGDESFTFEGKKVLTNHARYVVEYMKED